LVATGPSARSTLVRRWPPRLALAACDMSVSGVAGCWGIFGFLAYVCGGELLVGAEDGTAALGGVESTLASDGGLTVGTRATDALADLGDLVPVAHCEGVVRGCWWWGLRVVRMSWLLD